MSARITPRMKHWVSLYLGEANRNATEAARLAGYKFPRVDSTRLKRRCAQLIAAAEKAAEDKASFSLEETMQALANLVRDSKHPHHVRGVELALKVKGALGDKVVPGAKELGKELSALLKPSKVAGRIHPTRQQSDALSDSLTA